jgi:hypothetical protein
MTEAFFNVLTSTFLATSVWLLFRKNWIMLLIHLLSLFMLTQTRYIGIIYIVVSIFVALFIFKEQKRFSVILLVCAVFTVVLPYQYTKYQMKKRYGISMHSAFGGWIAANNVLVLMPEMKQTNPEGIENLKARYVHEEMIKIPDAAFNNERMLWTSYMWSNENSLRNVLFRYRDEHEISQSKVWIYVGEYMSEYAKYWKRKMPLEFAKRYYWLNFQQVFKHFPIEQNKDFKPDQSVFKFFKLSTKKAVVEHYPTFFLDIDPLRKIGHYLLWFATGLTLVIWGWKRKWFSVEHHKIMAIVVLFCAAYIGASIIGHPINNFRYFLPIYSPNLFFVFGVLAVVFNNNRLQKNIDTL